VSLSELKFDAAEKVVLRVHSSYSIGKHSPAEMAVLAKRQGLSVIALTDRDTVSGIPEMITAGEKLGIYVIPGVEANSSDGVIVGYFIDYQDENLLKFLRKIKKTKKSEDGTDFIPSSQEVVQAISKAGGLPIRAGVDNRVFAESEVTGADILPKLQEKLSDSSLHKDYFKRMLWRSANLSSEEFVESLQPQFLRIKKLKFGHLVNTTDDDKEIPANFQGYPFIIIRGESLANTQTIRNILSSFHCPVISEIKTDRYREIAWKIYKMENGSTVQKTRNLLKFNLDDRLYGKKSARCLVFFFQNPDNVHLREIKKALRTELGSIRFYRVEYLNHIDIFFTSFVHIPDEENIRHENWILHTLGISVPLV
jgi:DNA polymerase III alpha subunit (gram-positive type)